MVDVFKCLIMIEKFFDLMIYWVDFLLEEMKKIGYFSMENIEVLWSDWEDFFYLENKEYIIKILERMDIIVKFMWFE